MRSAPKNQISPKALTVWKLSSSVFHGISLLVVIGIYILKYFFDWPYWIPVSVTIVWAISAILSIFIIPKLRHRIWRYEVFEHEIDLQFGVFVVKRVLVPMVRVQHVDTQQGPLLKKYKLATVTISTAATTHVIPALNLEEADQLRDFISKLARVTDDDV
ncbi:PH domain-containing protein [Metabacillus arenae]|uniref:PH domain-containing protein n=1 Tax=Metabacillus arenae TaxID=2771434 RepID=A0A926NES1_9BACI|nr:PH domain-containing protein [Metabacillus arenae]MBD1382154.1 PH domain-containing protein [Metabacillus arenae]